MSKIIQIYNQSAVYAGPAPASGYHCIAADGTISNEYGVTGYNSSLLFNINRVQSVSYSFNVDRTNISNLGKLGTLARPILNPPTVNLSINYLLMGLINEKRLGFLANHKKYNVALTTGSIVVSNLTGSEAMLNGIYTWDGAEYIYVVSGNNTTIAPPFIGNGWQMLSDFFLGNILYNNTGQYPWSGSWATVAGNTNPATIQVNRLAFLSGSDLYTGKACPISGFYNRSQERTKETDVGWPLTTREPRNIFIPTRKTTDDFNDITGNSTLHSDDIDVYAFGDCYITNYRLNAGVDTLPNVQIDFICDNLELHGNGSGQIIPSLDPQNYVNYSGIKYWVPNNYQGANVPIALLPSDIQLNINDSNNSNNLSGMGIDFRDVRIQSFDLNIPLNRTDLYSMGYKLPLDRKINFPVISNLTFDLAVGDTKSGSFVNLLRRDENYNISIKLNYSKIQKRQAFLNTGVAVQLDFIGAKFNDIQFTQSTKNYKTATLSFSTELDPNNTIKGLFISGQLGVPISNMADNLYLGGVFDVNGTIDELLTSQRDLLLIATGGTKLLY